MKLHLPLSLRRSLLLTFITILPAVSSTLYAGVMHPDVSLRTYTDFGQNRGRYASGPTNALLNHIRQQEGGVTISYTGGQPTYTLQHGMIDFSSQSDGGYGAAIGYNWYATVEHNAVHDNTYAGNSIGASNAVHYAGIEYRYSQNNTFRHTPYYDYKITRQSKLITDVTGSTVYGSVTGDYSGIYDKKLVGQLVYRAGSGRQGVFHHDGSTTSLASGYVYITGAIASITSIGGRNQYNGHSFFTVINPVPEGVSAANPLPYVGRSGDSGSPVWVWNEDTQQFEYLSAVQSGSAVLTNTRGASEWTVETMESYNVAIAMPTDSAVHLVGIYRDGETLSDSTNNVSTTLHYGKLTDDRGNDLLDSEGHVIEYRGIPTGIHTWKDLSGIKDQSNWYAYGKSSLNATPGGQDAELSYADLFHNDNLVFVAPSSQEQHISVDANIDLGIGYVQLSKAEGVESASFTISSAEQENGEDFLLNSAGYVVDEGVSLHLQLTNSADYMREWRKIGNGNLFIEGSGDNNILLNLGGNGTTYLQRENGYSAYNVLANNGTRVVISDIGQIKRDFTFGFRGGVLDMNGQSMLWNNDNTPEAEGFTIHALDEHAIISNGTGESTLTWTQGGQQTWLGSFADTTTGALKFVYDGGADSVLTMHSIHTNLSNHGGSGIEVASGKVRLVGTNVIHGMGSLTGTNRDRYFSELDWHYADATAHVAIRNGAVFELDSHARLTGDITIESGGTFIMHEGVQQRHEYLEGGYTAEDTYLYRDFYGLKGNMATASGATVRIQYSEGTTTTNVYSGNITGEGNVEVNLGTSGGTLVLEGSGSNYSGEKSLTSGTLIATDNKALGAVVGENDGKWKISEEGVLASRGFVGSMASSDIMAYIDPSSTGVLALTADRTEQLDVAGNYRNLYIGALSEENVHYGTADQNLAAYLYKEGETHSESSRGYWRLGGGGGNLIVDFKLTGANDLILGNAHGKGQVTLTNTANDFSGSIIFNGAITLNYDDVRVLGKAHIKLDYSTRVPGKTQIENLDTQAQGILLLTEESKDRSFNLSGLTMVSIGSDENLTYTGSITPAEGAAYHFGGGKGTLTIASELASGHDLVIDAQTYNNGTIIINHLANIDGSVSISGFDANKTELREGDVTLRLLETQADMFKDNAVTLTHGGILDISGTRQTFTNLTTGENSFLVDSSAEAAGVVTLTTTDGQTMTLAGSMEVADITLAGNGTIELGGTNVYNNLRMDSGTVRLISDGAFSGDAAWMSSEASLNLNGHTVAGKVFLANGVAVEASAPGSGIAASGALIATEGTSSILTAGTTANPFTVSGSMGAAAGATLELIGDAFAITGGNINSSGGTLSFAQSANIRLATGTQVFGGTFRVAGGTRLHNGAGSSTCYFDTLHIDGSSDQAVTLNQGGGGHWNATSATIAHLNGTGLFIWDSGGYTWNGSRTGLLTFNGEGNFDGVVSFVASTNGYNSPIARYAELTHDKALQNATLNLAGHAANRGVALAINTGNAHIRGLSGSELGAFIYAGAAGGSAASVPVSSRQASVTLTGDGTYEFPGSVGINDSGTTNGISLVMAGSGTQAFTGDTVIINNVEVQKGTLRLETSNILDVRGDISVAQGASLVSSKVLTLNTGKTLSVLADDAAQTSGARLSAPSLTLSGGALSFSAKAFISESTASLQGIETIHAAEGINSLVVNIVDTSALSSGRFFLADGDWSAASGLTFTTTGLDYLTATYTADSSGLYIDLSAMDGHFIWNGDDSRHSWSNAVYGAETTAPGSTDTAIFNNVAAHKDVSLDSPIAVGAILFDNSANNHYTLTASAPENAITAGDVTQRGNGSTEINAELTTNTLTVESGVLTLKQDIAATTVSIQNNGTLEAVGSMSGVTTLSMGSNSTLRFTGSTPGNLSDLSSLVLTGGGNLSIGNANMGISSAANRYFTTNTTLTLDGSILNDRLSSYRLANSTFSLEGNGTLYVNGLRLSDQQSSLLSTLNIGSGSTLVITGSEVGQDGDFALSHWPTPNNGANVINIAGTLTSNAQISAWDSKADINIRNGGVLNLLRGLVRNTARDKAVTITAESGSRLNAAGGTSSGNLSITLQPGSTLGAIGSEVTFTNAFSLGDASREGAVTIDTTCSTAADDGSFAVQQGEAGGVITLAGNIGSYTATSLAIAGKGTVNSRGTLAVGKDLLVQDTSTLRVAGAIAVHGNIQVTEGATLLLNGATLSSDLTLGSGTLSISGENHLNGFGFHNSGTISLADDARFDLELSDFVSHSDGTYTYVFSRGDGVMSHSDSLTLADIFVVNGSTLTAMGEDQYSISRDNGLSITLSIKEVSWAGETGHTWETTDTIWYLKDTAQKATFRNMDSVTFGADGLHKTVSLGSDKTVNYMLVEDEGYMFDGAAHTINVASNLTLTDAASSAAFHVALAIKGNMEVAGQATFSQAVSIGGALTVSGTATFNSLPVTANTITVTGSLGMAATANAALSYRIDAADGSLSIDTQGHALTYNAGSLRAGSLRLTGGGSLATNLNNLNLPHIELGAGTTLQLTNAGSADGANKSFGDLRMENDTVLAIYDAYVPSTFTTIGKITLNGGTATVTDTNHSGYNHINALSGSGTLQFHKAAKSTNGSVYELGSADVNAGDFSGNIILRSVVRDNGRRSATLVISNGDIAKNAVVTLDSTNSANSTAALGLGIHADTVTLAGLASNRTTGARAIVYSGTLAANTPLNRDDACTSFGIGDTQTVRTLAINTADDTAYTYYGRVLGNLNIVKRGGGTQTFAGASADFNGSLSVEGGALAFHAASKGMLSTARSVTVGSGATLDLSAIAFDEIGTQTIALGANSSVNFAEGGTLNLARLADGTYRIFQPGETGSFEGWQTLSITMGSSDLTRKVMNLETDGLLILSTDKLLWRGTDSASWAADDRQIWLLQSDRSSTAFRANDSVVFDDEATASRNVVVAGGGVAPETMSVTGEGYTFSGGTISVTDSLTISSTGSATFNPGHLTVGGKLTVEGSLTFDLDSNAALSYNLDASNGGTVIFDTTSAITYNSGALKATNLQLTGGSLSTSLDVNLASVTLGASATLTLESLQADSGSTKTIGTVSMGNDSVLAFQHIQLPNAPVTVGGIALNGGTGKLTDTNGSNSAYVRIEALSGSGTLNLTKEAVSSYCTVYELGSATASSDTNADDHFSGTISISSQTAGSDRPTVLTISNGDIASRAIIHLGTAAASETYLGLGIHADHTTIVGLTSDEATGNKAVLFSGSISSANVEFDGTHLPTADAIRTLAINTAAGANHTFNGQVLSGLNLEKTGTGTQTFAGTAALASVDVQGGTLAFTGSLTVSDTMTVGAGGNLTIGGNFAFDSAITSMGKVTLLSGANIVLNSSDFTHGVYTVVSSGTVVAADSDFASKFTIDGNSLADMSSSQYSFKTTGGGLTLTINGFWAGTEVQHTWSDAQFGPHTNTPGINDTAFFTDEAENKNVSLASNVRVHHAEFGSSQTYRITASETETLFTTKLSQLGTGETHIDAKVVATDVAVQQGSLSLGKKASISGTLTAADNTRLYVSQANIASLSLGQNVTIGSASDELAYAQAGTLTFPAGSTLNIDKTNLTVKHGDDRWLTNVTQTINLTNGAVLDDRHAKYRLTGGTLNIDGGGTLYIKGLRLNDSEQKTTTVNVKNGSSLIITGSGAGQDGDFSLSHYPGSTAMNIGGTLTSNAIISSWNSRSAQINVQNGGTLNLLKGLSRNGDRTNSINLAVTSGARLNSAGGMQNNSLKATLQVGSTLGSIGEDVTFTNNFALTGNGTVTLDTNYSTADDAFLVTQGTQGGTVTLSGSIAAGAGTTLAIVGNGTANFTGNNSSSFAGDISVQSGATLKADALGKSVISAANSVTVGSGATLDLSAIAFDENGTNAISLAQGHTFTFSEGSMLNLGRLENGTYRIFNAENGGTVNWTSLTRKNLTLEGQTPPARAGITFHDNGSLTISLQNLELVWNNNAATSMWDYAAESWLHEDNSTSFGYRDNVRFSGTPSGNVEVASDILVANVTFDADSNVTLKQKNGHTLTADTLTINGTLSTDFGLSANKVSGSGKWVLMKGARQGLVQNQLGSLSVEVQKGATLVISDSNMGGFAWSTATTLEGQGEVEVNLSDTYGNTINVGTAFTGTTYVKGGNFTINGSVVGSALRMADGANMQLNGGSIVTFGGNLILDGTTQVHQNTHNSVAATFILDGSLIGTGTYDRRGGGTLTVTGETNLANFKNDVPDGATSVFQGKTTLGNLLISKSNVKVTFEDNTAITNGMSVRTGTGNTVQFTGDTASVTGDIELSGNNSKIQFADTTISANGNASIREATIKATKAQGEGGVNLLELSGEPDTFATLDGSVLCLAESTKLVLEHVAIGAGSSIAGAGNGNSTVVFNHATMTLPAVAAPAVLNDIAPLAAAEGDADEAMTLTQTGTTDKTCFIPAGTNCYVIAASTLSDTDISGSSLTLDVSAYAEALEGYDLFSIVFADGVTINDPSSLSVTATTGTKTYAGFYRPHAQGAPVIYFGKATEVEAVPEPTTTTLGLLALAALAARRRRRG